MNTHTVKTGDKLYECEEQDSNKPVGTITLFAQQKIDNSGNRSKEEDSKNTNSCHNSQDKEFYAITAGHCVEQGQEYGVKGGDDWYLLGKCSKSFIEETTSGQSVDIGVLKVYEHSLRQVRIDPYLRVGTDVKREVKFEDAKEDDVVFLYAPQKIKPCKVESTNDNVDCVDPRSPSDTYVYRKVDTVEGDTDIKHGDSGTVIYQDKGPGVVVLNSMLIGTYRRSSTNRRQPQDDEELSSSQESHTSIEFYENPAMIAFAIPMRRTMDVLSELLGFTLEPFTATQPPTVEQAEREQQVGDVALPGTVDGSNVSY